MSATLAQRRIFLPVAIAVCFPALARAGQEALNVDPAADATAQEESPLQRSFQPGPLFQGVNAVTDLLRGKLKNLPPFFRDTVLTLKPRTYYLDQARPDGTRSEAWALGGSLEYTSGRLGDRFQIGAELFTSQPLYAPADADGTLLLKPGQEGYTVLGQLYAKLRLGDDDTLTVGRREFSTPYVNRQFNRMTPNTFEAVALKGSFTGLLARQKFDYEVGYLSKVKLRNADTFIPMSQAVPFATEDEGTVLAQALFTVDEWAFGVANYFTPDTLNIFYAEATWAPAVKWPHGFKLSAQLTDQREVGGFADLSGQVLSRNVGLRADDRVGERGVQLRRVDHRFAWRHHQPLGLESDLHQPGAQELQPGRRGSGAVQRRLRLRRTRRRRLERIDHPRRRMGCARPQHSATRCPRSPSST